MFIRGLIPRNFAELAEAVPIAFNCGVAPCVLRLFLTGPWIGLKPVAFPDHTYLLFGKCLGRKHLVMIITE